MFEVELRLGKRSAVVDVVVKWGIKTKAMFGATQVRLINRRVMGEYTVSLHH